MKKNTGGRKCDMAYAAVRAVVLKEQPTKIFTDSEFK